MALALHLLKAIILGIETVSHKRGLKRSGVSASETKAASDFKLKDSSKSFRKSKNRKVIGPVPDRFRQL